MFTTRRSHAASFHSVALYPHQPPRALASLSFPLSHTTITSPSRLTARTTSVHSTQEERHGLWRGAPVDGYYTPGTHGLFPLPRTTEQLSKVWDSPGLIWTMLHCEILSTLHCSAQCKLRSLYCTPTIPPAAAQQATLALYHTLGQLLGRTVLDSRLADIHLSPALWSLIRGEPLCSIDDLVTVRGCIVDSFRAYPTRRHSTHITAHSLAVQST
jgi:HECT-like ubiquitin-transferase